MPHDDHAELIRLETERGKLAVQIVEHTIIAQDLPQRRLELVHLETQIGKLRDKLGGHKHG